MFLVDSKYDIDTGTSSCTVHHNGKTFTAFAELHPDDRDIASRFAGCEIAEARAEIKALKEELKQEKMKCEEVRKLVAACSQCSGWDKDSATAKVVYRQLNIRIKKVNKIIDMINDKELYIMKLIGRRSAVIKAIDRHRSIKNN